MNKRTEWFIHIFVAAVLAVAAYYAFEILEALRAHPATLDPNSLVWAVRLIVASAVIIALWFLVSLFNITPLPKIFRTIFMRLATSRRTSRYYRRLVNAWSGYITFGDSEDLWWVREALCEEYTDQEVMDLSGEGDLLHRRWTKEKRDELKPEGRPLIITSFVRYSRLVEAMVKTVQRNAIPRKKKSIICITTLEMPLDKWFNFDERFNCIHPEWEGYLSFLNKEIFGEPDVVFVRVLLTANEVSTNPLVKLQTLPELRSQLNSWTWVSNDGDDPDATSHRPPKLTPISYPQRIEILQGLRGSNGVDSELIDTAIRGTANGKTSYLILPEEAINEDIDLPGGAFRRLGREFINMYHSRNVGDERHAYYAFPPLTEFLPNWNDNNNLPPMPLDIFFVGVVDDSVELTDLSNLREHLKPVFCLGSQSQAGMNYHYMSRIYLVDPAKQPLNFPDMERYVYQMLDNCRPLSELVK